MTKYEAAEIADIMVDKYEGSAFTTPETLKGWIASTLVDVAADAARIEHDKIEKFIGTRKFQEVRAMIDRAKFKWGARANPQPVKRQPREYLVPDSAPCTGRNPSDSECAGPRD